MIFPLLFVKPYVCSLPSIDGCPRDSVSLQNTQKTPKKKSAFCQGARIAVIYDTSISQCAFVYLAVRFLLIPLKIGHIYESPYFCQRTTYAVIDLLSFLLAFCKGHPRHAAVPVNTKSKLVGRRRIRKSNFSMSPNEKLFQEGKSFKERNLQKRKEQKGSSKNHHHERGQSKSNFSN